MAFCQSRTQICKHQTGHRTGPVRSIVFSRSGLGRVVVSALRPVLLRQDGVCPARLHDVHQHVQRATVHGEGDRECRGLPGVALQLSLLHAAVAPPGLMHRQEPAGRLVDVHDAVCTDSVLVLISQHSLMNSRCVLACCCSGLRSSLTHLAGFLKLKRMPCMSFLAQVSPGRTSSSSASSHPCTNACYRHRAEAQDVGHTQDVLAQPRHVW